jgi:hypothetical protein
MRYQHNNVGYCDITRLLWLYTDTYSLFPEIYLLLQRGKIKKAMA